MGKAKKAALRYSPTSTNNQKLTLLILLRRIRINRETFKGKIEFRDVWFRYPSRKNEWVFKGINLTFT